MRRGRIDFATASEHHIVEARKLLRNAVRFLNPIPRLEITAPANVETVVTDDPETRTLRVHLLGYNSPPQTTPAKDRPWVIPGLIEDAPQYSASVSLPRRIRSAKSLSPSTKIQRHGNRVDLNIADLHEVVILRYEPSTTESP